MGHLGKTCVVFRDTVVRQHLQGVFCIVYMVNGLQHIFLQLDDDDSA